MAILRKPGAIVEEVLPGDQDKPPDQQTRLFIKVPSEGAWRQILRMDMLARTGAIDGLEILRTRFGAMLERIENLKFDDGTVYQVDKDKDGKLTPQNMAELMGLHEEISMALDRCCRVSEEDAKNS